MGEKTNQCKLRPQGAPTWDSFWENQVLQFEGLDYFWQGQHWTFFLACGRSLCHILPQCDDPSFSAKTAEQEPKQQTGNRRSHHQTKWQSNVVLSHHQL